MLKNILQTILARSARRVIACHQPEIIGITGSVGKTSAKEAIAAVIRARFSVRETYKNYNNEIGLPLTILGEKSAGRSIIGWLDIIKRANTASRGGEFPQALILEMGIDRPGDMDYLLSIAKPTRAVITKLGQAHLEFFKSLEQLHTEKVKLARAVNENGFVIFNYDDERLRAYSKNVACRTISFGFEEGAEVRATALSFSYGSGEEAGLSFKMELNGSIIPVFLPAALGRPPVYAALAAAAVGLSYDMNGLEIAEALRSVRQPAGRLHLLAGVNNCLIIDDTYNSSPDSVFEGLAAISSIPKEKRQRVWAVLGSMKELGQLSEQGHQDIGKAAAEVADFIVAVGEEAKVVSDTWFSSAEEAIAYIKDKVEPGDLLFIKGSQAVRLEKLVKKLMLYPEQASELLVRQGNEWKDK